LTKLKYTRFQWTASPASYFTVSSGSGLTFTTAKNGTNYGEGTITLSVITPSGTYVHNKKVWVGRPAPATFITDGSFAISGNTATICRTFGYCMTAKADTLLKSNSNTPSTVSVKIELKNDSKLLQISAMQVGRLQILFLIQAPLYSQPTGPVLEPIPQERIF
jgi:hypothetical protein